ncbi:hypothetical protein ACFCXA_30325 [Streptomyces virginiae]|uniref:hypothetical protein n=1 Tax=Streptomyces virginiae TaxID=1961 RepID=UPI0035DB626E
MSRLPHLLAPELAAEIEADHRPVEVTSAAEVHTLAATLWRAATGTWPRSCTTARSPASPRSAAPSLSTVLSVVPRSVVVRVGESKGHVMRASYYRNQLDQKQKARAAADKKVGEYRKKEADKRAAAAKAQAAAAKASSQSTQNSKLREAERQEDAANAAARDAASWSGKAARFGKEAADLHVKLAKAEQAERARERKEGERKAAAERRKINSRLSLTEERVESVIRQLREPKKEKLRVLMLGAASGGDLRVNREQARIRSAVERSLHRDLVELDVHPAATIEHLLDGLTRFRPHVVHFSGHSDKDLIVFEQDLDEPHDGAIVSARAFSSAIKAVDEPPLLVLLNSCHSAAQSKRLVETVPFAIGMADEVDDTDAINYAARFYTSVADGQSIQAAHMMGRAIVEMTGSPDHELPVLTCASDVDPSEAFLVQPPH